MQYSIVENVDLSLVELDKSLRIVWSNGQFRRRFQLGNGVGTGSALADAIPDEGLESIARNVMDSGETIREAEIVCSTGDVERCFLVTATPGASAESVLVSFYEVTEWTHRQRQSMEATRMASIGKTVAGVAHEINNPLAAIMGLSQLALREDLPPKLREDLEKILAQASRAANVVASLQTFAGAPRFRLERIDVASLLGSVVEARSKALSAVDVTLKKAIDPHVPAIRGDDSQLQRAFEYVLTNAEQAIAQGGNPGTLTVSATATSDTVRITFADDGPGIRKENLERIFDPFFTTREVGEGTGLGLSMCYRIIQRHGGSIVVDSAEGEGASFTIELPVAENLPSRTAEGVAAATSTGSIFTSAKLLVVDDEPAVADIIARTLGELGYTVDIAGDGTEVVGRTDLDEYSLFLLDVKMPGIGGMELYDYMHQLPGDLTSKVVFVTGDTADLDTRQFLERTGNLVLEKPFGLGQLLKAVGHLVGSRADSPGP